MNDATRIREHMPVRARPAGSDRGEHIGTVDRVESGMIKLARGDARDDHHHYIPLDWVERVDGDAVILKHDAATVRRDWRTEGGPGGGMSAAMTGSPEPTPADRASRLDDGTSRAHSDSSGLGMSAGSGSSLDAPGLTGGTGKGTSAGHGSGTGMNASLSGDMNAGARTSTNTNPGANTGAVPSGTAAIGSGAGSAMEGSRLDRTMYGDAAGIGGAATQPDAGAGGGMRGGGRNIGVDPAAMPGDRDTDLGGGAGARRNDRLYGSAGRDADFDDAGGTDLGHRSPDTGSNTPDDDAASNLSGDRAFDADGALPSGGEIDGRDTGGANPGHDRKR